MILSDKSYTFSVSSHHRDDGTALVAWRVEFCGETVNEAYCSLTLEHENELGDIINQLTDFFGRLGRAAPPPAPPVAHLRPVLLRKQGDLTNGDR